MGDGVTCLSLLAGRSIRRLHRGLTTVWRSLSPQYRRLVMTLLLAGFLAELQQRCGIWQTVKSFSSGQIIARHSASATTGAQKIRGLRGSDEDQEEAAGDEEEARRAQEGDKQRDQFTRPVVLGDRGRARSSWALRQQYLSRTNCDVTFSVEGRYFPAHRCWVASFSMPLRAMFNSGMRESQEHIVQLCDTDAATFELLLDFIYDGAVELTVHNIESVLELSVRYGVAPLVEQCCDFLAGTIDAINGFGILTLADKYQCQPLRRDALLFVVVNFEGCWDSDRDGFARLSKGLVVDILRHDAVAPRRGEEAVFYAAVEWLEADQARGSSASARDADLVTEIMSHVRFPLIAPEVLVEQIETHPIMQHAEACRDYVLEAYRFQALNLAGSSSSSSPSLSLPCPASGQQSSRVVLRPGQLGARGRPRMALHVELDEDGRWAAGRASSAMNMNSCPPYELPRAAEVATAVWCSGRSQERGGSSSSKASRGGAWVVGETASSLDKEMDTSRENSRSGAVLKEDEEGGGASGGRGSAGRGRTDYDHLFFGSSSSSSGATLSATSSGSRTEAAVATASNAARTVSV